MDCRELLCMDALTQADRFLWQWPGFHGNGSQAANSHSGWRAWWESSGAWLEQRGAGWEGITRATSWRLFRPKYKYSICKPHSSCRSLSTLDSSCHRHLFLCYESHNHCCHFCFPFVNFVEVVKVQCGIPGVPLSIPTLLWKWCIAVHVIKSPVTDVTVFLQPAMFFASNCTMGF